MKRLFLIFNSLLICIISQGQVMNGLDPHLKILLEEAYTNNPDLRIASKNIEQAEAMMKCARLAYLPSFVFSPSATLNKAQGSSMTKTYTFPITMDWEISLAGRQKGEKMVAKANCEKSKEMLRNERIQLTAAIANAYYTLVMLDQQKIITQKSIQNQESTLSTIRTLKEVGKMNELAINESEANCLSMRISLVELEQQISKTENALSLLLNRQSGSIIRSSWQEAKEFPLVADSIVELVQLSSRPDVRAAQQTLAAACGNEKIAKSAFFPSLKLSADVGWTNNIGEIINPGKLLLNLIASLTQPIFERGPIKAQHRVAVSQREQAEIAFERRLLIAGNELHDALTEVASCKKKEPIRKEQLEASRLSFENCQLLLSYSQSVSYLDVLTAQNVYLNAQLQVTAEWLERQQASINIYKALCPQP